MYDRLYGLLGIGIAIKFNVVCVASSIAPEEV